MKCPGRKCLGEKEKKEKEINTRVIDRCDPRPTQQIVHISTPCQPDRWAPPVGFAVFTTKFQHQCSVLRIRRIFCGFLCPGLNVVSSCYPNSNCGGPPEQIDLSAVCEYVQLPHLLPPSMNKCTYKFCPKSKF